MRPPAGRARVHGRVDSEGALLADLFSADPVPPLAEALRVQAWAHYFQDDPRHFLEHAQASHRLLVGAGLADGPTFAKTCPPSAADATRLARSQLSRLGARAIAPSHEKVNWHTPARCDP